MPIDEFCTEYNLGKDIFNILDDAGFEEVSSLIGVNNLMDSQYGLELGHVAELRWSLIMQRHRRGRANSTRILQAHSNRYAQMISLDHV